MGYVFISYSHDDTPFVQRLASQLRKAGIEVWADHNMIHGEDFERQIEKQIAGSAVFVSIMSTHSQASSYVTKEAGWAVKYQRKIMPVSLDGIIFPAYRSIHCEMLTADAPVSPGFVAVLKELCQPSILFVAKSSLAGHRGGIRSVDYSPGSDLLVSAGDDRTVRLWGSETGNARQVIAGGMVPTWPAVFTRDGGRIAAPSLVQSGVHLWSASDGALVRTLGTHAAVRSVAFSPGGALLATGGADRAAHVWDARSGAHMQKLHAGRMAPAWPLCFSSDGTLLAVSNFGSNSVSLWNTASLEKVGRTDLKSGAVTSLTFDHTGQLVISGGSDGRVELDTVDGASVRDLRPHVGTIHAVACSPGGNVFATAGADGLVKIIALATGEELQSLAGHTGDVYAVAFSRDGQRLASAGADATIRIWQRK